MTDTWAPDERTVAACIACLPRYHSNGQAGEGFVACLLAARKAMQALLPQPVDPDLIVVREIFAVSAGEENPEMSASFRDGTFDENFSMVSALAALKRGRELADRDAGR